MGSNSRHITSSSSSGSDNENQQKLKSTQNQLSTNQTQFLSNAESQNFHYNRTDFIESGNQYQPHIRHSASQNNDNTGRNSRQTAQTQSFIKPEADLNPDVNRNVNSQRGPQFQKYGVQAACKIRRNAADDDEDPFQSSHNVSANFSNSDNKEHDKNTLTNNSNEDDETGEYISEDEGEETDEEEREQREIEKKQRGGRKALWTWHRVFLMILILILYLLYSVVHVANLLGETPGYQENVGLHGVVFHLFFFLIMINYSLCIQTNPGTVPRTHEWIHGTAKTLEFKADGEKRWCKWCRLFKPDRCHHCKTCGFCTLKMDHHCPWLGVCVGFYNHKYFLNFLIHSTITLWIGSITIAPRVFMEADLTFNPNSNHVSGPASGTNSNTTPTGPGQDGVPATVAHGNGMRTLTTERDDARAILLMSTLLLYGSVGISVTGFLCFQMWLVLNGMTTIEFCEYRRTAQIITWSQSCCGNMNAVFGPNPACWFCPCPCGDAEGNGLRFSGKFHRCEEVPVVSGRVLAASDSNTNTTNRSSSSSSSKTNGLKKKKDKNDVAVATGRVISP